MNAIKKKEKRRAEWEGSGVCLRIGKVMILYKVVRPGLTALETFNQDLKEVRELGKWIYVDIKHVFEEGVV